MKQQTLVEMRAVTKRFGKVTANENVNFKVNKGEIHALLGENGAGKSTLMNMLSGIYTPDSGFIFIRDQEIKLKSPRDAIDNGIGMIHQHFKLVDALTATENIVAGQKGNWTLNKKRASQAITEISQKYGLIIDPGKYIADMSVSEKQTVEILKVLFRGADILILDEPTAVLTPQETLKLFDIMLRMKEQGCAVILITHKLDEVMAVSDRITILHKGHVVATLNKEETSPKAMADLMVGKAINLSIERPTVPNKKPVLQLNNISVKQKDGVQVLKDISFKLQAGEILGVAGVAGSGQRDLCETIAGLKTIEHGEIWYENENIVGKSPREIYKMGISMSFVPEDRLGMGLVSSMDMVENILIRDYQRQKGFFINRKPVAEKAQKLIQRLNIQTPGIYHPVKQLSGGNIQKVLLGREIDSNPEVLITAYPVRGLDIGASMTIYELLNEQKKKGVAILFIGEDLDVLRELCDRIVVMCDGRITGIVDPSVYSKEDIGLLMAGGQIQEKVSEKHV